MAAACESDKDILYSLDYLSAPGNVSAFFGISQDNTGLVTIIPNADGAQSFAIDFGDGSENEALKVGEAATHIYAEGVYDVTITAAGATGLTSSLVQELNVTFKAPENLVISVENDPVVSKKVKISANADYATVIDYYFGDVEEEEPTTGMPDEIVSHNYDAAGDYQITVVAKSGAIETLDSTFTFTVTEILIPTAAAPAPPVRLPDDVISIFSGAYTDLPNTDFNPNWGQLTVVSTEEIEGNPTLKYATLNYQGTQFESPVDASAMEYLHIDLWTADATAVNVYCISNGPAEKAFALTITQSQWTSYDIPLTAFSDVVNLSGIIQFKFDGPGGETIFMDNIYFYRPGTGITSAAPAPPARDPNDVISIFSEAYTDVAGTNFNPDWGQNSVATIEDLFGNSTLKYANLNYQGTELASSIDVSSMEFLHIDMWTADASLVNFSCISSGPQEKAYALTVVPGQWESYDIPLSAFSDVVDMTDIFQLKVDGTSGSTIYLDNIYFFKGSSLSTAPALPLDFESSAIDYTFTDFDGGAVTIIDNPQSSGINTSAKVARMVKNAGQTWAGSYITLENPIDFSAGNAFKMKVYSPRADAKVLLKVEDSNNSAIKFEKEVTMSVADQWEELVFDFSGINTANSYDNVILIFDLGTMGDGSANFTYLFDDISLFDNSGGLSQIDHPVTFESTTVNYTLTDFGGNASVLGVDPTDAGNTVAITTKTTGAQTWAGTTIGTELGFASVVPLTLTESTMSIRIYSPAADIPVRLKGEDHNNTTLTVETEAVTTTSGAWETLTFDFTNVVPGTNPFDPATNFDKFSIFFNFGVAGANEVYYWDDVMFNN